MTVMKQAKVFGSLKSSEKWVQSVSDSTEETFLAAPAAVALGVGCVGDLFWAADTASLEFGK